MGPDPFNMPGAGAAGNQQQLTQAVGQLAPFATQWHGPLQGAAIPQIMPKTPTAKPGGVISRFAHFIGGIGGEIGHIAGQAANWLGHQTANMVEAPFKTGAGLSNAILDRGDITAVNNQTQEVADKAQNLHDKFKAGQITSGQYQLELKLLNAQAQDLSNQSTALNNKVKADQQDLNRSAIDTASTIVTILTAGFGGAEATLISRAGLTAVGAKTTADYLTSINANAYLSAAENGIKKLASDSSLFAKLSPAAQKAIQTATAEVVSSSGKMSVGQIARASAANLALKYPIYYNYLSGTGSEIYNQLDNKKYGDATRTLAFNALLLLSGGPIGHALKYGGRTVAGLAAKTFSRTPFLDELSKGIGGGEADGLYRAILQMPEAERSSVVRDLSAVEATNMNAAGNDSVAAAWRVIDGMSSYEGLSMNQFTHEEALHNMVNFARAQRLATTTAQRAGLADVTVGRIDARMLNEISLALSGIEGADARGSAWEAMKAKNPNVAWANNENLDRQIHNLITRYDNPGELDNAIRSIKASFQVDGFPSAVARQLAKMGYIPIKPVSLEAPFKEGAGKITTSFTKNNNDIFIKSVRPLPILGWLGAAISRVGLSPYGSRDRVYQVFNENLGRNLQESGIVKELKGESLSDTTDTMIKQLSSYAHNPTEGRLLKRAPITDLRMLTTKDIEKALGVTTSESRQVKKAIAGSMLQVPLAIRGLGDKLVDISYPALRRYLRTQGAVRFSYNPFFQYLRVIPKTEFLSEVEGGGIFNSMFAGRLGEISNIRQILRGSGMLEEAGRLGNVMSGEAVDFTGGALGKNLNKKLLPMQERSIAGLIDAQAGRMGMDGRDYIQLYPDHVRDTIQMIAEYDRRASFLNSPLARTLNIAIFPFRFDAKVATILTRNLAKTSLLTQVSVINGVLKAHDWLNSDEGKAWYAQNSEAIGLFKYISPIATFGEVFSSLLPGHDHSLGNFGELGGLPFGFIPQILDSEGLTHFNQAAVDSKTGAIIPEYLPVSDRGQIAIAVQDFLGTLFSYPGATIGLPSKTSLTRMTALGLTGANKKTDLRLVTPTNISAEQQQYSGLIQHLSGTSASTSQPMTNPLQPGTTVPATPASFPQKTSKGRSGGVRRLKKAQFRPALLPGQSSLGEL